MTDSAERVADGNCHLCSFSMDTLEITEPFLIFLFFLIFMTISQPWNEERTSVKGHVVSSCNLQSQAQTNLITKELNSCNSFSLWILSCCKWSTLNYWFKLSWKRLYYEMGDIKYGKMHTFLTICRLVMMLTNIWKPTPVFTQSLGWWDTYTTQ